MTVEGRTIRLGTRGSRLALRQSEIVAGLLTGLHPGIAVELVRIETQGDQERDKPLWGMDSRGVFVKEIQSALWEGRIDLAVHSLKDLPSTEPDGLALGAMLPREDPRDALVSRDRVPLAKLPLGARLGTSSPRRATQLLASRPDLQITDLRGNVDTRVRKAKTELDGAVLALAGLRRLGLEEEIAEILDFDLILPAPGQGAITVEARADDAGTLALLAALDDAPTRVCVTAERALVTALEAGCSSPLGALGTLHNGLLTLRAAYVSADGQPLRKVEETRPASDPEGLANLVARMLTE